MTKCLGFILHPRTGRSKFPCGLNKLKTRVEAGVYGGSGICVGPESRRQWNETKERKREWKESRVEAYWGFAWVEVLQVRSRILAAVWKTRTNETFACAKKEKKSTSLQHLRSSICLNAHEKLLFSTTWLLVTCCFLSLSLSEGSCLCPGDMSAGGGGARKWDSGHSCPTRFLPSVFVFLFPYPTPFGQSRV